MQAWIRIGAAAVGLAVLSSTELRGQAEAGPESGKKFYFQVVYGADSESPPKQDAKAIGPKLRKRLRKVFRWENYWEVNRGEFKVEEGKTAKVNVSERRRLEIEFVGREGLEVRMLKDGKPVRKMREQRSVKFMLVGGDDKERQSWFIILRGDKPSTTE